MNEAIEHSAVALRQFRRRPRAYLMTSTPSDQKFLGFMISASGVGKDDCVLDVACGTGSATLAFAERCARVVGIDVLNEPLRRGRLAVRERELTNADFALSEMERFPFPDGAFTGAICRFSFHHFVHPERVFAEMARVVEVGGWMVIADLIAPEEPEQAARHDVIERLCDATHARALPVSEFEQMFAQHGFELAMKVARDSRVPIEDWIRFGEVLPEQVGELRTLIAKAIDQGTSKFIGPVESARVIHTTVSFVLEKQ